MKQCTKCGELKNLEEFYVEKKGKLGRRSKCKLCMKSSYKEYREAKKEKIAAQDKAYREANKEKIAARDKAYREANKEKRAARNKAWQEANRDKVNAKAKRYRDKNKEKVKAGFEDWKKRNPDYFINYRKENKEKINEHLRMRTANDGEFKAARLLRHRIKQSLNRYKNKSTIELVGCSPAEFHRRNGSPSVEELNNLDIDHIVPISWFDLSNEDHVMVASNWTNLQYLDSNDNRYHKKDRYAGRPDAILGYKEDFDLDKHVKDMVDFINENKKITTIQGDCESCSS